MGLKSWLKMPVFYLCGACYIGMRIYVNIFGSLLAFYIVDVLKLGNTDEIGGLSFNLALIPM